MLLKIILARNSWMLNCPTSPNQNIKNVQRRTLLDGLCWYSICLDSKVLDRLPLCLPLNAAAEVRNWSKNNYGNPKIFHMTAQMVYHNQRSTVIKHPPYCNAKWRNCTAKCLCEAFFSGTQICIVKPFSYVQTKIYVGLKTL